MANEDIDRFCEDGLLQKDYRKRYEEFLTGVKVATRGKNTIKDSSCYKLETYHDRHVQISRGVTEGVHCQKEVGKLQINPYNDTTVFSRA